MAGRKLIVFRTMTPQSSYEQGVLTPSNIPVPFFRRSISIQLGPNHYP